MGDRLGDCGVFAVFSRFSRRGIPLKSLMMPVGRIRVSRRTLSRPHARVHVRNYVGLCAWAVYNRASHNDLMREGPVHAPVAVQRHSAHRVGYQ